VVLVHADLSVATEDNKSGSIDTDATFRVRRAGTRLLSLSLINHVDPDARNWDTHRHTLRVKRILDADGHERTFSHKYGELVVEIAPTAAADTDVRLRFETGGEIFVDMSGYHTDNYFALQGFPWYPSPPLWAGQRFTYTLKAKVKKPWRPVTSGREVSLRDEGPFVVAEARSDRPAMQIAVMGGKYFTHAETIEGITVRVHSYAWNRKTVLEKMPRLAVALIKVYENMLGPIAINELDIVEVPSFGFGIAPSGMVLITSEAYADIHDEFASGINARLAHEIAHQWFGHKAVPIAISDNWLAESFAEYFAGVAMGMIAAKEKTVYGFNDMLIEWRADGKNCTTGGTIATANYLGGRDGYRDRRCLLYSRGPLVLQMLRTSIGNDRFAAATRKYLDAADGGPVTTDDYAKAVSDVVQMDMRWYFDQWVRRSGNAAVDVDKHVDPAEGGQYRLWGTIRQTPGTGFKKLLVPLVWESGGKTEARVVFADQPEKKFEFMLPTKPGVIKPDPFQNNLAVYK
jgi:aminopeptidase N